MDTSASDELRKLRHRAYGPNADIHQDPAAMERLQELEGVVQPPEVRDATGRVESPKVSAPSAPEGVEDLPQPDAVHPQSFPSDRRWSRRRLGWTWAGSLAVAVLFGAALSSLGSWLSAPGDPVQVGTLREADLVWPEFLGTETADARGFTEFLGITAITSDGQWAGGDTDTCMIILKVEDAAVVGNEGRMVPFGCGTAAFPANVQFKVTADMPAELIDRFPVGSELQFVLTKPLRAGLLEIDVFAVAD